MYTWYISDFVARKVAKFSIVINKEATQSSYSTRKKSYGIIACLCDVEKFVKLLEMFSGLPS